MAPYQYRKLDVAADEIRLASLLPGTSDDPIRLNICNVPVAHLKQPRSRRSPLSEIQDSLPHDWDALETLEGRVLFESPENISDFTSWTHPDRHYPIENYDESYEIEANQNQPIYEALSYNWGSAADTEIATVEDLPSQISTLSIGQNLAIALRHLRHSNNPRTLWIDAICINQEDLQERSNQVVRMGDIYQLASRVIIWLGPAADDSGIALSKLQFLGKQVEYTRRRRFVPSPGCQEPDWFSSSYELPYTQEDWNAIYHLTSRSWFERLWVLQEAQLARSTSVVKCGQDEIPWRLFRRAILCLNNKKVGPPKNLRPRLKVVATGCKFLRGMTLGELLLAATGRKCRDPRDKIYGTLNIAPDQFASRIHPDYTISTLDLYRETFMIHASLTHRLSLLQQCNKRNESWPSWVPNWSESVIFNSTINVGFCASGVSSSFLIASTPNSIKVVGLALSTISSTRTPMLDTIAKVIMYLQSLGIKKLQETEYPGGGTSLDAYLHTFTIGTLKDRMPWRRDPTLKEWRDKVINYGSVSDGAGNSISFTRFENDIINRISKQAILKTDDGYIGLGSNSIQSGRDPTFVALSP